MMTIGGLEDDMCHYEFKIIPLMLIIRVCSQGDEVGLVLEFEALHVPALNKEVANSLEQLLQPLPGIIRLRVNLESRTLHILFDEDRVDFLQLTQAMAQAGCPLRQIDAALLKKLSN